MGTETKTANFSFHMQGQKGNLTAKMTSPSGKEVDCELKEQDEGSYSVVFDPQEEGEYVVNVFLDGRQLPGTKFKVDVNNQKPDPSKVSAYGPGLKGTLAGKSGEFTVNALDAGSGSFSFSIEGPGDVKINCEDQDDGTYKIFYSTDSCGTYKIGVSYAGVDIPGSPFKVQIVSTEAELLKIGGDASKCKAEGAGLKNAVVGETAKFTIDAGDAGAGGILVGIDGPAVPAKELIVNHIGKNIYEVKYIVEEAGSYKLHVLWSGKNIPGSPFPLSV